MKLMHDEIRRLRRTAGEIAEAVEPEHWSSLIGGGCEASIDRGRLSDAITDALVEAVENEREQLATVTAERDAARARVAELEDDVVRLAMPGIDRVMREELGAVVREELAAQMEDLAKALEMPPTDEPYSAERIRLRAEVWVIAAKKHLADLDALREAAREVATDAYFWEENGSSHYRVDISALHDLRRALGVSP